MIKLKNLSKVMLGMAVLSLTACSDDATTGGIGELTPEESAFGKANDVFTAEEWYPGGQLGTTEKASYSAITPAAAAMEEEEQRWESYRTGDAETVFTAYGLPSRTAVPTPSAMAICWLSITQRKPIPRMVCATQPTIPSTSLR